MDSFSLGMILSILVPKLDQYSNTVENEQLKNETDEQFSWEETSGYQKCSGTRRTIRSNPYEINIALHSPHFEKKNEFEPAVPEQRPNP